MNSMMINKRLIIYCIIFIFLCLFSIFRFDDGKVGDFLVTNYDELRYLLATDNIIQDTKVYGIIYTLENFYNYTQSVHFLHYFVLSFFRYFFNDSMVVWSLYQLSIYTLGCYFFGKFIRLEYDFISTNEEFLATVLMLLYPVFYFLTFSLMRDIAIFSLLSICLYFYKSNNYKLLILFIFVISLYRLNMMLCILVYILIDQFRDRSILSILKYLILSALILFVVDKVSINFLSRHLSRIYEFNFLGLINEVLVFLLSPLPFSVDQSLPQYLRFWFMISFWLCVFLIFIYIVFIIKKKNIQLVLGAPIIGMSLFYIATYSIEAGIGFRQSSILLPFIYIPIFLYFIKQFIPVKSYVNFKGTNE
ncbi:hypothetical protein ACT43R_09305 [Acinetobacter baumannii]|uniref:hypothetical protein n=1 Tax=Acinetobacter baumannii TaxID=470 RepID=UPI00234142DB|nr:hypothetical protein [Acinetobacter baumannii]MDC5520435.1 hypothetical protein [Acinetobacter baumannii]MDH2629407.1 hypothetical protein [Acinetobacter baumannii]HDU8210441.1 hypothetical protein [Acinetobacter baumannii]